MRVISRPRLRKFWEKLPDAETPLRAWERGVKGATWANWAELKQRFGSADLVGTCTVFDIANNKYRLIARVFYGNQRVYILKIMTHAEYDEKSPRNKRRSAWEEECRCHDPRPKRAKP